MRLIIVCRQVTSLSLSLSFPTLYPCINIWSYSRVCLCVGPVHSHVESAPVLFACYSGRNVLLPSFLLSRPELPAALSVVDIPVIIIAKEYIPFHLYSYPYEMLCVSGDGEVQRGKSQETSLFIGWHQWRYTGRKNKNEKKKKKSSSSSSFSLCTRDLILSRELISSDTDHHPIWWWHGSRGFADALFSAFASHRRTDPLPADW